MITAIGDVWRRCYERRWITTRDGNCSLRRARSSYYVHHPIRLTKNHPGELRMHYLLLKDHGKTRAVVHVHHTHMVAAIFRRFDLLKLCTQFPEIHRYIRVGAAVPFLPAVSTILGEATAVALGVSPTNPDG